MEYNLENCQNKVFLQCLIFTSKVRIIGKHTSYKQMTSFCGNHHPTPQIYLRMFLSRSRNESSLFSINILFSVFVELTEFLDKSKRYEETHPRATTLPKVIQPDPFVSTSPAYSHAISLSQTLVQNVHV